MALINCSEQRKLAAAFDKLSATLTETFTAPSRLEVRRLIELEVCTALGIEYLEGVRVRQITAKPKRVRARKDSTV